jgi:hypothetical protein
VRSAQRTSSSSSLNSWPRRSSSRCSARRCCPTTVHTPPGPSGS